MKLSEFLVKAKINTYASEGRGNKKILKDGSKQVVYEKEGFRYRDRYFGYNPFVGEEIVWKDGKSIWAMNYYGKITSKAMAARQVYGFLKKALRQVKEKCPFRGPARLKHSDLEYLNEYEGDIESFRGTERILYRGQEIYILFYHGGTV